MNRLAKLLETNESYKVITDCMMGSVSPSQRIKMVNIIGNPKELEFVGENYITGIVSSELLYCMKKESANINIDQDDIEKEFNNIIEVMSYRIMFDPLRLDKETSKQMASCMIDKSTSNEVIKIIKYLDSNKQQQDMYLESIIKIMHRLTSICTPISSVELISESTKMLQIDFLKRLRNPY